MELDPQTLIDQARTYGARGVHGRVVESIGRRIVGGEIAAGEMLPKEAELMTELHTSRTSIREAVKVLSAKGLLETRQKRGTLVRPREAWNLLDPDVLVWSIAGGPDPRLTHELTEMRRLIEPGAVALAAERHNEAQLAALAAALADMRRALNDPLAYYVADLAFHRALFTATGNPFIDRLGSVVDAVLAVSFALQRRSLIPQEQGLILHETVFERVAARDVAGAKQAMLDIIESGKLVLERSIGPMAGLRPELAGSAHAHAT
ncbi:FadR/GntR family transcriptional regulator [Geminicoccus roseus]|uniref:FadR/GntR family transcriptional regulator n=1 Tax=Geminicoccus roseus TaxID=404900 RepID=UPI0003F9BC64|nr:FadR/GntR family transcriptional regulator [Geminicoccus roseus]